MKTKICGIYKITSPSGKINIGQSLDIHERWRCYKKMQCKGQRKLYASIVKYGWENHTKEIICQCNECDLNNMEIYYMELFQSRGKNGLNIKEGGDSGRHSEETKLLIALKRTGVPSPVKGIPLSEDAKKNMRKPKTFPNGINPRKGTKIPEEHRMKLVGIKKSEETKQKIRDKAGRTMSPESCANLSVGQRKSEKKGRKTVYQFSMDGILLATFKCARVAAEELNLKLDDIRNCCKGYQPSAWGYYWSYEPLFVNNTTIAKCKQCGNEFEKGIKHNRVFCSHECWDKNYKVERADFIKERSIVKAQKRKMKLKEKNI